MNKHHRKPEKPKEEKTDSDIPMDVQRQVLGFLEGEFSTASTNMQRFHRDFDDFYGMLHCERQTKPNTWESDIFLPEFPARNLAQIGEFAAQYFQSRDFVESDIDDAANPQDVAEGKASKALLNTLLNESDAHYFQKMIRLLNFVFPGGYGIIKGGYEQEVVNEQTGFKERTEYATNETGDFLASDGGVFNDTYSQTPMTETFEDPVFQDRIVTDKPVFDVYPVQNVYMSPEYAYTLNDKEYVIFEEEKTLDWLKDHAETNGYFNLDLLEQTKSTDNQEFKEKSYGKDGDADDPETPVSPKFVIRERWGRFPAIVTHRTEDKKPVLGEPGFDATGRKDNAENVECIVTYATETGGEKSTYLIGFRVSLHSKRPMARFLCYVDPLKDSGYGDGEMNWELQVAINDNYNLGNFRTKLATTPFFKGKRFSGVPDKVTVSPEKVLMTENMDDLEEFKISDNIQGSMVQHNMLSRSMDYAMAKSPTQMGQEPVRKETATQATFISQGATVRNMLKSMTLEFIGFTEFYEMLLTLCNDFMLPDTLVDLIGEEHAYNYNPKRKDKFKPVSQALETEESKQFKMRMWDQILGRIVGMAQINPKAPMLINYCLGQFLESAGGDFKHFKKYMLEEDPGMNAAHQILLQGGGQGSTPNAGGIGAKQNQTGLPQGGAEQKARGM